MGFYLKDEDENQELNRREMAETIGGFMDECDKLVHEGLCPCCKKKIEMTDFKDDLSRKEFQISGMCASCQDSFFDESS